MSAPAPLSSPSDTPTPEPDLLRYYAPEPDADADWAIPKLFDAVRSPDDGARAIRIAARLHSTASEPKWVEIAPGVKARGATLAEMDAVNFEELRAEAELDAGLGRPVGEFFEDLRAAQPAPKIEGLPQCVCHPAQPAPSEPGHVGICGVPETQPAGEAAAESRSIVKHLRDAAECVEGDGHEDCAKDIRRAIAWIEGHVCQPMTATLVLRGERDLATLDRIHTIANRAFGEGDDAAKHDALAEILDRIRAVPAQEEDAP